MNAINSSNYNDNQNNIESEREFNLYYNNNLYTFKIIKTNENISIKCKQYEINFDKNNLSFLEKITKKTFQSIDKVYKFFVSVFEYKIVTINEIYIKNYINIIISNKIINFELPLKYVDNIKSSINNLINTCDKIMDYIYEIDNNYKTIKNENIKLKSFVYSLNHDQIS